MGWVWGTKLGPLQEQCLFKELLSKELLSAHRTDLWVLATNIIIQVKPLNPVGRSL